MGKTKDGPVASVRREGKTDLVGPFKRPGHLLYLTFHLPQFLPAAQQLTVREPH